MEAKECLGTMILQVDEWQGEGTCADIYKHDWDGENLQILIDALIALKTGGVSIKSKLFGHENSTCVEEVPPF
jgi:hypothetical protein